MPDTGTIINLKNPDGTKNLYPITSTKAIFNENGENIGDLIEQITNNNNITGHIESNVNTESGVHGIKYFDNKLQFYNGTEWVEISTGGSGGTNTYKVFGVSIDLSNSNPETSVTYTDDAIGMVGGSSDWDSQNIFKDIKPCLLKGGSVNYYLNPNDFTKKIDGTDADITSGNDGDVMIEIPKTGYKINTIGNTLTVQITDNPNAGVDGFRYYAHTRATEGDRNKLYIGAYLGSKVGGYGAMRSLSGKTVLEVMTINSHRTNAQPNGAGYDLMSFYPLTLLQCLYLIKYKNLDSQTALGRGYVDGNATTTVVTGGNNTKGMDFGETTGKIQMKLFGIEDLWGNCRCWIDGICSDANRYISTSFQNFNDSGSYYYNRGQAATANISGYITKPQGTTETGFIIKEKSGSETTYFCDSSIVYSSTVATCSGFGNSGGSLGIFGLELYFKSSQANATGRLMFL